MPLSRRDFVALAAAGAVATPLRPDGRGARAPPRHGAGDRRPREEEHRRRLEQRRRRYVQDRRSVDGRHRRRDDVHGDAGRAPEGRPGRREFHHHGGADLLLEGGPEHARRARSGGAVAAPGRGQVPGRGAGPGAGRPVDRRASAGPARAPRRRCHRHRRCRSPSCHRDSAAAARLRRRRRRRIRSTPARTTSSPDTSWWCSA